MKYGSFKYGERRYGPGITGAGGVTLKLSVQGTYITRRYESGECVLLIGIDGSGLKRASGAGEAIELILADAEGYKLASGAAEVYVLADDSGEGFKIGKGESSTTMFIISKGAKRVGIVVGNISIIQPGFAQKVVPLGATIIVNEPETEDHTGKISVIGQIGIANVKLRANAKITVTEKI